MARQGNAAPVIIKRKKIVQGGGHHGGAWKVAYADFVTAMMAFFLLMWLLGATTEKQRKGVADYFSPSIPLSRVSGGGDGAFGGDTVFTEETFAHEISDAVSQAGASVLTKEQAEAELRAAEKALTAFRGESITMERALRHVISKVTDEGLVIEIYDLDDVALFAGSTDTPEPILHDIARMLAEVLLATKNSLAVNGYVRSYPIMLINNPVWNLSAARAQAMRGLMGELGLAQDRVQRVSGFADRKPITADPMAARNNRLEVILLRRDR